MTPFERRLLIWRENFSGSFSAKVRWRMKHDRNPLLVTVQDKYLVRQWALSRGVETVPLLQMAENADAFEIGTLPPDCFVKASHGCGWNLLRREGVFYEFGNGTAFVDDQGLPQPATALASRRVDDAACRALWRKWLGQKYLAAEWAYQLMTPRLLAEPVMAQKGNGPQRLYRLFTMAGVVQAIAVGGPVFVRTESDYLVFDRDWTRIRMPGERPPVDEAALGERPQTLPDMLEIARRLGSELDFVRIDLFDTPQGAILNEMTVYPSGGQPGRPFVSATHNRWLGRLWTLPGRTRR